MNDTTSLLQSIDLFKHLNETQLTLLLENSAVTCFPKYALLINEGEVGNCLFVIKSGLVKVFVSDEDGKELVLHHQGPGTVIGDIALLDDSPRSASVSALEQTSTLKISKTAFLMCIESTPGMASGVIQSLTHRLRQATVGSRSLALDNVYQRLADKLRELAVESDLGIHLDKKYSYQELGSMIGASREMVGKVMSELIKGEYVEQVDGLLFLRRKLPPNW